MADNGLSLAGPGGIRPIWARWVITARVILESPAHFGGQSEDPTDMPLLRDAREGKPLLPGTSIAGALRSHLADILVGYGKPEPKEVALLFGDLQSTKSDAMDSKGNGPGIQSPLIIFDSIGSLPDGHPIEIRDGVAIQPETGTAEEKKKFDYEVLPVGTTFPIHLELIVGNRAKEAELIGLLRASLTGLADGELSIGARRSRGLGRLGVLGWRAYRYELSSAEGWLSWLLTDPGNPIPARVADVERLDEALHRAWPDWDATGARDNEDKETKDKRRQVRIDLKLILSSGILVRSPGISPDAPDSVHLASADKPMLSGTSLAGALRSRALRIARVVRRTQGDADYWIEDLFGPRFSGETPPLGFEKRGSRLRVTESIIKDGLSLRTSRIRLDRLTQGVTPSALFDEEPVYGGNVAVQLEIRNPRQGETGLILLLVKDILSGDLAVGGTASIGRGVLKGQAAIRLEDGTDIQVSPGKSPIGEALERLEKEIQEFHQAPLRAGGGREGAL